MHPLRLILPALVTLLTVTGSPGFSPPQTSTGHQLWRPPLDRPLEPARGFDLPHGPYRAGHRGIDLRAAPADRIRAPVSGIVIFAGTVVDRPVLTLRVDERTLLSLEPVTSALRPGDTVARGEVLGAIPHGSAGGPQASALGGHCGVSCLHLGVRVDEVYVNPLRYLRARPVLLPW